MTFKLACIALGLLHIAATLPAAPANTLEDLLMVDDTMSVGSYVREVRAAAPNDYDKSTSNNDYDKSKESEADGEIGYSRKKSGGGKRGYQHFDAYHKKAGDHYAYEKQDSFGHEDKGQDGAYSHNHERRAERESDPEEDEEEERPKKKKQRKEKSDREELKDIQHDELKEGSGGSDDGNGGVEASGHDPNDYKLPERYTYGDEDEEFNF